mmetsp:Transcript_43357/g.101244  ORF Transcript_43357/g.101244 Transcript_43357/m.101244 type:complete len:102 (-) Transcript_43357:11-316(-)
MHAGSASASGAGDCEKPQLAASGGSPGPHAAHALHGGGAAADELAATFSVPSTDGPGGVGEVRASGAKCVLAPSITHADAQPMLKWQRLWVSSEQSRLHNC